MRGAYCYLPILAARDGAFRAVSTLSPLARSRLTPLFDVPAPALKEGKTLDAYLTERANGMHRCWDAERPMYVDVHDLSPDLVTSSGEQPITYLLDLLRVLGSRAIPVTGTEVDRGKEYLNTIRGLFARSTEGVCLRFARDELNEPKLLHSSIEVLLKFLAVNPAQVDVVLDFRYVGKDRLESLRATTLEALQAIHDIGLFRNVTIAGSSVPDLLNKRDQGKVRRETRVELDLWSQVVTTFSGSIAIALGDYGVVGAHHAPPSKPVSVPSRVRYTTSTEHVFRRAKRNEYSEICRQLVSTEDFLGPTFSVGDQYIGNSAKGLTGPGSPAIWVANDTNHHLELVSAQAWKVLQQQGLANRFALADPKLQPWLQPELLGS